MSITCAICERLGMTVEGARALHFITCPAYHNENGKRRLVHQGHCWGAFEGVEPCKHYIGNKAGSSSVCWCKLANEQVRSKEAQARAMREQAARERERQEELRQMRQRYPIDVEYEEISPPWDA